MITLFPSKLFSYYQLKLLLEVSTASVTSCIVVSHFHHHITIQKCSKIIDLISDHSNSRQIDGIFITNSLQYVANSIHFSDMFCTRLWQFFWRQHWRHFCWPVDVLQFCSVCSPQHVQMNLFYTNFINAMLEKVKKLLLWNDWS